MQKYLLANKRLREVMRICTLQSALAMIICSVSFAHPNYAQQVLNREVTITLTEVTIEKALREIGTIANVKFVYSPKRLKLDETISLRVEKKKLGDLLTDLLAPRGIEFTGNDESNFVVLKPGKSKDSEKVGKKTSDVGEKLNTTQLETIYATITGTVTDGSTKLPMPGVNVIVKETTNGTSTDSNGKYTVTAEGQDILLFSFIGFTTQEIQISGRSMIDVVMQEDAARLNEVVVNAGYWNVKEKENTGNISKVTSETIAQQPVTNPLLTLQGRMPGVYIQQRTGLPGSGIEIKIRGTNSLRSDGNFPLYVVDGIPFVSTPISNTYLLSPLSNSNPLNNINPSDIESIEILKDASATSIYGSRGANGVVLITTKRAKAGKSKLDVNFYTGVGKVSSYLDLLDTKQYVQMRKEAFKNDGVAMTRSNARDLLVWDTTRYTNWQKELIGGSSKIYNIQATVSGGDLNTQYSLSGTYYKEGTVFPGDFSLTKASGNFNFNHVSPDQKFRLTLSSNYIITANDLPREDFTTLAINLVPNAPALYDENGQINWEGNTWTNPLATLKNTYSSNANNFIANTSLQYKIIPELTLKTNLGYSTLNISEIQKDPISYWEPQVLDPAWGVTASSFHANNSLRSWIIEPQAEFTKSLSVGRISILLGSTFQQNTQEGISFAGTGYTNDALLDDINSAPDKQVTTSSYSLYRYAAIFARLNYNWNGKYILDLTGRRDGSSRFGADRQFANFGAAGFAWIFSNENFIRDNVSFFSFGKLRGSYGTTGNDQIPNYGYLDSYAPTSYPYLGRTGLIPTQLANPEFAWEINKKLEVGLELGFFSDKILFNTSWYRNRSSNQLVGYSLSSVTGFSSVQANLPATVQNTGYEFELRTRNISKADFTWNTGINITIPKNKLLEYPDIEKSSYANRYVVGEPVTIQKSYRSLGVDPQTGIYINEDLSGDGSISWPEDITGTVAVGQEYFGGISNTLSYKGFTIDMFFQFVKQTGFTYLTSGIFPAPGGFNASTSGGNQPSFVMDRWQHPGDETSIQRFTRSFGIENAAYNDHGFNSSDASFGDASFIRFKNLAISWSFPKSLVQKAHLHNCRIYLQCQNLFTITNFYGDPESQVITSLPPLRIISTGIQITL